MHVCWTCFAPGETHARHALPVSDGRLLLVAVREEFSGCLGSAKVAGEGAGERLLHPGGLSGTPPYVILHHRQYRTCPSACLPACVPATSQPARPVHPWSVVVVAPYRIASSRRVVSSSIARPPPQPSISHCHCLSHPPSRPHATALCVLLCTCAPYRCFIPRHLGYRVPCIPSAAALACEPSVYSKSTLHLSLALCPCNPLARTSFLPARPRAQESVGAAWLDLAHDRRPPGLPPRTYQSTPSRLAYSSSSSFCGPVPGSPFDPASPLLLLPLYIQCISASV